MDIRQPIRSIFCFLCLLHVLAMCCILFCDFPWYDKFFLSIAVLGYFIYALCRYVFCISKKSVVAARRSRDGVWRLQFRDGKSYQAELLGDSVQTRFLSILNFRVSGKRQRVSLIYFPMFR